MTRDASALLIVFLFVVAAILICEGVHQYERRSLRSDMISTKVKLVHIDLDSEIEKQEGWE